MKTFISDISISIEDKSFILLFEELFSFFFGHTLLNTNSAGGSSALRDAFAGLLKDDVEIHTKNTSVRVILDSEVNVFLNTKAEIARVREVSFSKFEFFDFKSFFQDFICLLSSDGHMQSDLFVSLNTERSNGVSSLGGHGGLTSQIFQNLNYGFTF